MLAKLVDRSQRDWDTKIPGILSAYRTAKNESTNFSPFFILYGRDPVLPVDTLLAPKYRYQGDEYVPTTLENLHGAHHMVRHNLARSHERNQIYYDKKAKPVNLKVGDMVYFSDPSEANQSSKLSSHWQPFYRVIKALSDVTFVIKNQLSGGTKVVNAHNLRFADPNTLWEHTTEQPEHINSKYQHKERSFIPLRVQPPRRSKFSAADADYEPSEPEQESVSEPVSPSILESPEPEKVTSIPENLPSLPDSASETEQMSDEDEIPLTDLQRRWREEKEQEEIEENLPLSELAEKLNAGKQSEPAEKRYVPVKRPRDSSESSTSDTEIQSPPEKYGCRGTFFTLNYTKILLKKFSTLNLDVDSDTDNDLADIGACMKSVNVNVKDTNPSIGKATLLSQMMKMQQSMVERNQLLMERMLAQVEKL